MVYMQSDVDFGPWQRMTFYLFVYELPGKSEFLIYMILVVTGAVVATRQVNTGFYGWRLRLRLKYLIKYHLSYQISD